jgi:hypothetical protein
MYHYSDTYRFPLDFPVIFWKTIMVCVATVSIILAISIIMQTRMKNDKQLIEEEKMEIEEVKCTEEARNRISGKSLSFGQQCQSRASSPNQPLPFKLV